MVTLRLEPLAQVAGRILDNLTSSGILDAAGGGVGSSSNNNISSSIINTNNNNSSSISGGSGSSIYNMAYVEKGDEGLFFLTPPLNTSDNMTGNDNYTDTWSPPPLYIMIWITVSYILVFLVGVLGNLLVIVVVLFVREMKTSTNLCLMNLSLADLLVLLICQPSSMLEYYANEKWLLGEVMCKMTVFLENLVTVVSILIILTVSLERFWAVYYPLRTYSSGSKSRAMISMLVVWVLAAVVSSPFLVMAKTSSLEHKLYNEKVDVCETTIYLKWHRIYVIGRFVFVFVIPMVLLVFLYTMIILKVINKPMECKQMTETARAQAQQNRKQLVIMLVGIIVLFFFCLLPFRIFTMWLIFAPRSAWLSISTETYLNVMNFCRLLIYVNSAGNPIIYNMVSTKFRRAFHRVLRMYCRCFLCGKLGAGVNGNGNYSQATRMTTMSHYSVVKQTANDYSETVDTV